ncbi:CotH kinase family protein [Paenibacillus barengoltzii]
MRQASARKVIRLRFPVRSLQIGRSDQAKLEKSVWDDQYANALLMTDNIKENVKIRYRGGHTRYYDKKSYELRIGHRSIHYNVEWDDPTMMRNALSFRFFEKIGVPSPRTRHVYLVINGVNQGLYLEIEGVDRSFFTKRKVNTSSLLYAINNNANFRLIGEGGKRKRNLASGYELVIGTSQELARISRFVERIHTLKGRRLLAYMKKHLDIPEYLRWLGGAVCTGNFDGFTQNYAIFRKKGSLKYQMSPWDYEGTWGRNSYGKLSDIDNVRIKGYNGLTQKLLSFPSVRRQYRKTLKEILERHFTVSQLAPTINSLHSSLMPALMADSTRKYSTDVLLSDRQVILDYIAKRREYLLRELEKL